MRTKVVLVLAAIFMLLVGGTAVASNMGFKITIPLKQGWSNYVSLPYFNSYTNAASLFNDVGPTCVQVSRWNNAIFNFDSWTGLRGTDFNVTPGEALIIKVSSDTNWIVVGSHNPNLALTLTQGYSNYVSIPYNTTANTAGTLFNQIPGCVQVSRWNNSTFNFDSWTGLRGTDFNLTPGEGLIVKVSATTTWTPAHY